MFQTKVWKDLGYHDEARHYQIMSYWSPNPPDVERNLRKHVVDNPRVANPTHGDLGIKVDFVLVGFGLWSVKPEFFWNQKANLQRFSDFRQSLPRIMDVSLNSFTDVPNCLHEWSTFPPIWIRSGF